MTETIESMPTRTDQQQFAQALVEQARSEGVELIGPGGLLTGLTKPGSTDLTWGVVWSEQAKCPCALKESDLSRTRFERHEGHLAGESISCSPGAPRGVR